MPKSHLSKFTDYIPAQLHEGKSWYISYYVKNPTSDDLERKRIKFNRIKSISERRRQARYVVAEINVKLKQGWNPFLEAEAPRAFTKLTDAFGNWLRIKKKELRHNTYRSYESHYNILKRWLTENGHDDIYVINFTRAMARDFMTAEYAKDNVGEVNFNNKLAFFKFSWNFFIESDYTKNNVFDGISKKIEKHKKRIQYIKEEDRKLVRDFFYDRNRYFYIICMLEFHCLMRPQEITHMKFEWINLDEQYIYIPGSVGKNKKDRYSTIPDVLLHEIKWLMKQPHEPHHYIFGKETLQASKFRINPRRLSKWWDRMREATGMDKKIQFYSLRDTGIIQKLKDGVSPDDVMYQADHSGLDVTNKYVKIATPRVLDSVRTKASKF